MPDVALLDFSALPRLGIRGSELDRWIRIQRYTAGSQCNRAWRQSDSSIVARLSDRELIWLADCGGPPWSNPHNIEEDYSCYTVLRVHSHDWFALRGHGSASVLATLCGVNLCAEQFPELSVAQTSMAGVFVIVIADSLEAVQVLHLLVDSSYRSYLWKTLQDACSDQICRSPSQ